MKKTTNKRVFVNVILHIVGFSLCVTPPAVCTLCYFPLWKSTGFESCISGGVALLLALCCTPLYKLLSRLLKNPSSYILWLICFLLFFALSKIADEMTVISFVGFIGNLLGAFCFWIGKRWARKDA